MEPASRKLKALYGLMRSGQWNLIAKALSIPGAGPSLNPFYELAGGLSCPVPRDPRVAQSGGRKFSEARHD